MDNKNYYSRRSLCGDIKRLRKIVNDSPKNEFYIELNEINADNGAIYEICLNKKVTDLELARKTRARDRPIVYVMFERFGSIYMLMDDYGYKFGCALIKRNAEKRTYERAKKMAEIISRRAGLDLKDRTLDFSDEIN